MRLCSTYPRRSLVTIGRELYAILGVPETATQDEIRRAYRRRARVCHPDRGGDPDDWERLCLAYETLSDPDRRRRYDQTGDRPSAQPEEPHEDTKLMVILAQIIQNVVCGQESSDVRTIDVVEAVKTNMHQMEQRIVEGILTTESRISRNKEVTRRLRKRRRRSDSQDLLRMVLRGQREELRRVKEKQTEDLSLHRRVIRVFEGYDYEADIAQAMSMATWTVTRAG